MFASVHAVDTAGVHVWMDASIIFSVCGHVPLQSGGSPGSLEHWQRGNHLTVAGDGLKLEAPEILELYRDVQYAIVDSLTSLVFWRGQVQVGPSSTAKFPLYSLGAYVFCSYVVERPHLLPVLFFWCIFFAMLASYGNRAQRPLLWHRSRSMSKFAGILVEGWAMPASRAS